MLTRMRIMNRLLLGFTLILLGALVLGLLGVRSIVHLSGLTTDIFLHPFTVSTTILDIRADVLSEQQDITRLLNNASPAQAERLQEKLLIQKRHTDDNLELVNERFLGARQEIDQIRQALAEWRTARDEVVTLTRNGRQAEASALNYGRNVPLLENLLKEVNDVSSFAISKAATFKQAAEHEKDRALELTAMMLILIMASGIAVALLITRSIRMSLKLATTEIQSLIEGSSEKIRTAEAISAGDLSQEITLSEPLQVDQEHLSKDEIGVLIGVAVKLSEVQCVLDEAFQKMTLSLRLARSKERDRDWLKSGRNELYALLREGQSTAEMADRVLIFLMDYLKGGVGALYLFDDSSIQLRLAATYALTKCSPERKLGDQFRLGEGLLGQAAREQKIICLEDVPSDYLQIGSALGAAQPKLITAIPLLHGNRLVGVIEMGTFDAFNEIELRFLDIARETIAIGLDANLSHQRMAELLDETQSQAEELRVQQEELQQSNEELEERAQLLEQQRESIRAKNLEIEAASDRLRQKAVELERVSTYKSEFLANMSHELRTPLNSLMILSGLLMQNKDGNLSGKQVEYATTINSSGKDLLNLINDILDLSKVEAGQLRFQIAEINTADLCASLRAQFAFMAEQKGLTFRVETEPSAPQLFQGDEQRVQQILKNLLANALKFTEKGQISLRAALPGDQENPLPSSALAFVVADTGIGISAAKQQLVFDAFQQADGSISRKYGGTGLGLSISLQLARKMGGDIRISSEEGQGSVFTLYLPVLAAEAPTSDKAQPGEYQPATAPRTPARPNPGIPPVTAASPDAGEQVQPGDQCILIIEDDPGFANILLGMIRERGFSPLLAGDGEAGLAMASRYSPSAIILDVMLPRIDGWNVMRLLKENPVTRHIPVHFLTCLEDRQKALSMGAIGFTTKPVSMEQLSQVLQSIEGALAKSPKKLLIVEDNSDEAKSMVALLQEGDVEITVAAKGGDAIELLTARAFDCIILDLGLADMSGFDLLEHIQQMEGARRIPVIVHSGRELSYEDERKLRRFAESIIIKGTKSPERLLNEVSLFLHLVESNLHPSKQRMIRSVIDKEAQLEGKKVLLVDDDMRNVFSLTSALAEKNMAVIEAENGKEAIARLQENPDVSIVLMDIMMPEMDGYAAIREIRKNQQFARLPIIAMTAKALKGDQEKCMAAGASDYIAKPIEVDKLLSLIRVWVYQQ
ncbi:MAG: response regulator [Betaproteobacteria bacterium]|nr:response regulator [Betaproteobacteria bacterium]